MLRPNNRRKRFMNSEMLEELENYDNTNIYNCISRFIVIYDYYCYYAVYHST